MKKYQFKDTEEKFKLGDFIKLEALADENLVSQLLAGGAIEEIEELTLEDIIEHLDNRIDCDVEIFLENLRKVNKKALFILLLKEAALVLDNKYQGHIKYAKEIWGVHTHTYVPFLINDQHPYIKVLDFNKLAAFRSKEDAYSALEALKDIIEDLK